MDQLNIPYITLLDFDRERGGGDWGRIKYVLKQLLKIDRIKKEDFILTSGKILSDVELESMHTWKVNKLNKDDSKVKSWINLFEKYNIYFSYPVDLDFSMFLKFPEAYKNIEVGKGPKISAETESIKSAIASVLKKENKYVENISEYEIDDNYDVWFWYRYLFLGKGKPVSHLNALLKIGEEDIKERAPKELGKLVLKAKKLLGEE
ncbi:hypothetical protein [Fusobacterium sp. IOR10]|uniref:hypothetical protein n=1 Tax=Fusobacterium sp. IOR10 TaxID=2665157 RepID=UPI0013D2803A|nr:hypothetical protein [Fusobacterium sp. IOR10]